MIGSGGGTRLAEQKFRPLKKEMQQTFGRIKQALAAELLPRQRDVTEFIWQVKIMISYPGFGDAAYPELLALSEALGKAQAAGEMVAVQLAVQSIVMLQDRCHQGRMRVKKS